MSSSVVATGLNGTVAALCAAACATGSGGCPPVQPARNASPRITRHRRVRIDESFYQLAETRSRKPLRPEGMQIAAPSAGAWECTVPDNPTRILYFLAFFFVGFVLGPSFAHLLE